MKMKYETNIFYLKIYLLVDLVFNYIFNFIFYKYNKKKKETIGWIKSEKFKLIEIKINKNRKKIKKIKNEFTINDEVYPIF